MMYFKTAFVQFGVKFTTTNVPRNTDRQKRNSSHATVYKTDIWAKLMKPEKCQNRIRQNSFGYSY